MFKCKISCRAIGRTLIGAVLVVFGVMKITGFAGTVGYIASVGIPMPTVAAVIAIIFEVGGGLALVAGKYLNKVPAVLAAYLIVVTLIFHRNIGDQMQMMLFLKNVAIIGGLLGFCGCNGCSVCDGWEEMESEDECCAH